MPTGERQKPRKSEKTPPMGNGDIALSSPFLLSSGILSMPAYAPGMFFKPSCPGLKMHSRPCGIQLKEPPGHAMALY